VNVIPDDNNDANIVAPIEDVDEDKDVDTTWEMTTNNTMLSCTPCLPPTRLFKP